MNILNKTSKTYTNSKCQASFCFNKNPFLFENICDRILMQRNYYFFPLCLFTRKQLTDQGHWDFFNIKMSLYISEISPKLPEQFLWLLHIFKIDTNIDRRLLHIVCCWNTNCYPEWADVKSPRFVSKHLSRCITHVVENIIYIYS